VNDPVLLFGIPSEPPLELARRALERRRAPCVVLNQREFLSATAGLELHDGVLTGVLEVDKTSIELEAFGGVYARAMDHSLLPELSGLPPDGPEAEHARRLHRVLWTWCDLCRARVVNRLASMGSNSSKPFQLQLIGEHFAVPETLVTNDPDALAAFADAHGRVVYKSTSGTRSIVTELSAADAERLGDLRACPVQFQQRVDGVDVRVHTIADGSLFATLVTSDAADYRYGGDATMTATEVDDDVAERCLALAEALGLDFAGIDLRLSPAGETYCFEVNPSPAYSAYEEATGQPIADALAAYLAGATSS
jgi:hypothetical protein